MRQGIRSHPLSSGLFLLGGVFILAAVFGAYELTRTGKWLGAYLLLTIGGGIGVGSIGLGLFRYAFD
jgi:hypothetical protein